MYETFKQDDGATVDDIPEFGTVTFSYFYD